MAVINIDKFGGEIPRLPARSLPPGTAQSSLNLLVTADEFRPVLDHTQVASTYYSNPPYLWRGTRQDGTGVRITDSATGWRSKNIDSSTVKAQLNDDQTDRIYITDDTGATPPMAADVYWLSKGTGRVLGIPAPTTAPLVTKTAAPMFTQYDAQTWFTNTFIPAVKAMLLNRLDQGPDTGRFIYKTMGGNTVVEPGLGIGNGTLTQIPGVQVFVSNMGPTNIIPTVTTLPPAGASTASIRNVAEPQNVLIGIPTANIDISGLGDPSLNGSVPSGSAYSYMPIHCLPFWPMVHNPALLAQDLQTIASPRSGAGTLLTSTQAAAMATALANIFSNTTPEALAIRDRISSAYMDVCVAISNGMTYKDSVVNGATADPTKKAAIISAVKNAQATAESAVADAENLAQYKMTNLEQLITDALNSIGLIKSETTPNGIIEVDPDKLVDTRFYVTTWVSDWGEESAPSPVSNMVECTQYDSVTIFRPTYPTPTQTWLFGPTPIVAWRIYRTNVGNNSTAFQFVAEIPLGKTIRNPVSALTFADNSWTDSASWEKAAGQALFAYLVTSGYVPNTATYDTKYFQPGDTIGLTNNSTGQYRQRTWTGAYWAYANTPYGVGQLGYVDGRKSVDLGEVIPSVGWLPPPSQVTANGTTYLMGLTGGPGGVMAGFIDNMVAFCEPGYGYAWPVKYQVPLEYPVVGLGVFGSTWFVGTMGRPYLLHGADPANITPQKLDSSQSCASRKSIISNDGGVFYASPDGYCFADLSGVKVITKGLFDREDWQKLNPSSIFAVMHDNILYFWYTGNGGGCYALDTQTGKLVEQETIFSAVFDDVVTDGVYGVQGQTVYKLFSSGRKTGVYKTGIIVEPSHVPFAWLQVWGDQSATTPAVVEWWVRNRPTKSVPNPQWVQRYVATVVSTDPVRLPAGRFIEHQIKITSAARLTRVALASSTDELKQLE